MAFFAMVIVTLSKVSAVGFCEGSTEVFVGQHKVGGDSDCEHSSEDHLPTDCSEEPCEDNHVEIDLDVDDFARTSTEGEPTSPDFLPGRAEIPSGSRTNQSASRELTRSPYS